VSVHAEGEETVIVEDWRYSVLLYDSTDLDVQDWVGRQLGQFKPLEERLTMCFVLLKEVEDIISHRVLLLELNWQVHTFSAVPLNFERRSNNGTWGIIFRSSSSYK